MTRDTPTCSLLRSLQTFYQPHYSIVIVSAFLAAVLQGFTSRHTILLYPFAV